MELQPLDDIDDGINLESKVLLALSSLQKEARRTKRRSRSEVSCKRLVEFLKANYSWLDGDIESQVITALLSCVKKGTVCVLKNGNYRLIGPNSKKMVSNCLTRTSHGSRCYCLTMLKCIFKTPPYTCCYFKNAETSLRKPKKTVKRKLSMKPISGSKQKTKKNTPKSQCQIKCALIAQTLFGTSQSAISVTERNSEMKCDYCSEIHSPSKSRRMCINCHTSGPINVVPFDKFSPRDEVVSNIS